MAEQGRGVDGVAALASKLKGPKITNIQKLPKIRPNYQNKYFQFNCLHIQQKGS